MKKVVLLACGAALMLSACGGQHHALSHEEVFIAAKKIGSAPPKTILVFNKNAAAKWGIVCSHDKKGNVLIATVGYSGVWMCGSMAMQTSARSPEELAQDVDWVIMPGDADYNGRIEVLMLSMLGTSPDHR